MTTKEECSVDIRLTSRQRIECIGIAAKLNVKMTTVVNTLIDRLEKRYADTLEVKSYE